MTPSQEAHLEYIIGMSKALISTKYRAGQEEHGGNLFDLTLTQLLDEGIHEAIDQLVYLITAKQKLIDIKRSLHDDEQFDIPAAKHTGRTGRVGGAQPVSVTDLGPEGKNLKAPMQ